MDNNLAYVQANTECPHCKEHFVFAIGVSANVVTPEAPPIIETVPVKKPRAPRKVKAK